MQNIIMKPYDFERQQLVLHPIMNIEGVNKMNKNNTRPNRVNYNRLYSGNLGQPSINIEGTLVLNDPRDDDTIAQVTK